MGKQPGAVPIRDPLGTQGLDDQLPLNQQLDLDQPVCTCAAKADLARDKAELRNGAVFLLEEISCRAALSIELPRAPQSEELPDAQVAALIRETFGATDELSDDSVAPAE